MKNTSKKILSIAAGAVLCCALIAPNSQAVPIAPGADVGAVIEGQPTSGTLISSLSSAFLSPGANGFSGTLRSVVINNDTTNPFGPTGLTFIYQIFSNLSSAPTELRRLTLEGFNGFGVDASFEIAANAFLTGLGFSNSGGPGDASNGAELFDRSNNGDVIGSTFQTAGNRVGAGEFGAIFVFQTSATMFQQNDANVINGGVATARVLAPSIPEGGSTLALLGIALVAGEALRRKLRAA